MKKIHHILNFPITLYRRLIQVNHWALFALIAFAVSSWIMFGAWMAVFELIIK